MRVNLTRTSKAVTQGSRTRSESGEAGIMARLMTEDWTAMTAPARNSPNHVAGMDRWRKQADQAHPNLSPDQRERLAEKLRRAHYVRMGKLSAEARKIARQATAMLAEAGESADDTTAA